MKALCLGGGGVRVYGQIGALIEAENQGIDLHQFDIYTGTSAGSILAVLLGAGMTAKEIERAALDVPLKKLINKGFFGERLILGGFDNRGLGEWIDSFDISPNDKVFINAFDKTINKQRIFSKKDFEKHGYGYVVRCSTCFPGAVEAIDGKFLDGGISENPLMSILDKADKVISIHMGYAGQVKKENSLVRKFDLLDRIEDAAFSLEYKEYINFKNQISLYQNLYPIFPKIFDVQSMNFWIKEEMKRDLIQRGKDNTRNQWIKLKQDW